MTTPSTDFVTAMLAATPPAGLPSADLRDPAVRAALDRMAPGERDRALRELRTRIEQEIDQIHHKVRDLRTIAPAPDPAPVVTHTPTAPASAIGPHGKVRMRPAPVPPVSSVARAAIAVPKFKFYDGAYGWWGRFEPMHGGPEELGQTLHASFRHVYRSMRELVSHWVEQPMLRPDSFVAHWHPKARKVDYVYLLEPAADTPRLRLLRPIDITGPGPHSPHRRRWYTRAVLNLGHPEIPWATLAR